jgi:hypothetical protein
MCGEPASLAPRVHLREVRPGETPRDVALGLCESHGSRLRKGAMRITLAIEAWLSAEGRLNPANPLDRIRLLAHCLACDAPLGGDANQVRGGVGDAPAHTLATGETVVECGSCPALNVVEPIAGDAVAVQLYTKPPYA